jgi:hypothetical protein
MAVFLRSASDHPFEKGPSEPLASVGVTNREREEAKAEGQHDQVKHGILPVARASSRRVGLESKLTGWLPRSDP